MIDNIKNYKYKPNGISAKEIDEVANKLSGVDCGGRGTSCPDQLSVALKKVSEVINKENKEDNV